MTTTLLELAERVEAATGPDRELDGEIDRLLFDRPKDGDYDASENALWCVDDGWSGLLVRVDGFARGSFCARNYTASLDAAMSLAPCAGGELHWLTPEGKLHRCRARIAGKRQWAGNASTPALALCAAALRARASR